MPDDARPDPDLCPDCGHPWASHAEGGCVAWPREDAGPCTCKRERPKGGAGEGDD
jgi:hypothetical protein